MTSLDRPLPTGGPSAGGDEYDDFDDIFNYDVNAAAGNNAKSTEATESSKQSSKKKQTADGLGIDEEIEISKKPRVPRVKLDDNRLLSAAGIPRLRNKAKHLKFKGKGHEYSDAARLLEFYQLWLDDIFPKARFLDALEMVEKAGHKKRVQMMRMEWINEGRPRASQPEDSMYEEPALPSRVATTVESAPRIAPIFEKAASTRPKTPEDVPDMDDLYDATPRASRNTQPQPATASETAIPSIFGPAKPNSGDDIPPEDDLDALLAEEEMLQAESRKPQPVAKPVQAAVSQEDDFMDDMDAMEDMDDDMEAVAAMQGMW
ncbi:replication fork protection component Swi3-domain-containing protein [Xylogone sp. PMI_703]|nr:replication fork protection component Swi3-domain-containing protein [Xylogone sp. PMI_703]